MNLFHHENAKSYRLIAGYGLREAAKLLDFDFSNLWRIENGKYGFPHKLIPKMAKLYGRHEEDFLRINCKHLDALYRAEELIDRLQKQIRAYEKTLVMMGPYKWMDVEETDPVMVPEPESLAKLIEQRNCLVKLLNPEEKDSPR